MNELMKKLMKVIMKLKAPKGRYNSFGGFSYRSCEDILNAVKPLLAENGLSLDMSDDIVMIGDRYYVKATVTVSDGETSVTTTAFAREAESRSGMDAAQLTGSASSYARKYALAGRFLLDDNQDIDAEQQPRFELVTYDQMGKL